MATNSAGILSGSTDGLPIKVAATSIASGDTIHTAGAVTGDDNFDEVWLWAMNTSAAAVKLTLGWGGTTDPDHLIEVSIPGESGLIRVVPGLRINNSKVVKAAAASANVVLIFGNVNKRRA